MEERAIYRNLSPLDHRYFLSNRETFNRLSDYLSEEAAVQYCVRVEAALLTEYLDLLLPGQMSLRERVVALPSLVDAEEVYLEERTTQHNIRALVNVIKRKLPEKLHPYVHLGATSVDILDTANAMRVRDAVRSVILPLMIDIEEGLIDLSIETSAVPQVGRTHGQHAVPITFGFAVAEYVARFGKTIQEINARSKQLRGKLAGAVGAYNALSLVVDDPVSFERSVLQRLDLLPSEHSTQLVEPEYLLRLLLEVNVAFGVLANLADDLRNLQRSEIAEIHEAFEGGQVGSSTMPQKRNPWNSEHVKSLWKAFAPRVMTFFLDQISEHQRDLTNSASQRFVVDYLAGFTAALSRMRKILGGLNIDRERMRANIDTTGDLVLSEAAYILLATAGHPDAHEVLRRVTLRCDGSQTRLMTELRAESDVWDLIAAQLQKTLHITPEEFFSNPALYRGKATERVQAIAIDYRKVIEKTREEIQ